MNRSSCFYRILILCGILLINGVFFIACTDKKADAVAQSEESMEKQSSERTELYPEENFMLRIAMLSEYLTWGRRPNTQTSAAGAETLLLPYAVGEGDSEIWYYPDEPMSEEQLFTIIEAKYGDTPEEYYTPKEGQIQASEAVEMAEELLQFYVPDASEIEDSYLVYQIGRGSDGNDFWSAFLHLENSLHDYKLTFDADEGELMEWSLFPKDYYTPEGYRRTDDVREISEEIEEEEACAAAGQYANQIWGASMVASEEVTGEEAGSCMAVLIKLTDKTAYKIYISQIDLTVQKVKREK